MGHSVLRVAGSVVVGISLNHGLAALAGSSSESMVVALSQEVSSGDLSVSGGSSSNDSSSQIGISSLANDRSSILDSLSSADDFLLLLLAMGLSTRLVLDEVHLGLSGLEGGSGILLQDQIVQVVLGLLDQHVDQSLLLGLGSGSLLDQSSVAGLLVRGLDENDLVVLLGRGGG